MDDLNTTVLASVGAVYCLVKWLKAERDWRAVGRKLLLHRERVERERDAALREADALARRLSLVLMNMRRKP